MTVSGSGNFASAALPAHPPPTWGRGWQICSSFQAPPFLFSLLTLAEPVKRWGQPGEESPPCLLPGDHHQTSDATPSSSGKPLLHSNQQATSKKLYSTREVTLAVHKRRLQRETGGYFWHKKEPSMWEEHTAKHSKTLKGRSCVPAVSNSPWHFASADKDAKCSFSLILICLALLAALRNI